MGLNPHARVDTPERMKGLMQFQLTGVCPEDHAAAPWEIDVYRATLAAQPLIVWIRTDSQKKSDHCSGIQWTALMDSAIRLREDQLGIEDHPKDDILICCSHEGHLIE